MKPPSAIRYVTVSRLTALNNLPIDSKGRNCKLNPRTNVHPFPDRKEAPAIFLSFKNGRLLAEIPMAPTPLTSFEESHHARFMDQGYLRLGNLLSPEALAALQRRIDEIMLGDVSYEGMPFQLDGENGTYSNLSRKTVGHKHRTLKYRRIDDLQMDPLFLTYMQHPLVRDITRRYIGEEVSIFRAMFMNKPAEQGTELPWHQDIGKGWGLDQNPTVTVWTALDDATVENGCMQIVPGSNRLGILNEGHYTSEEDQAKYARDEDVIDLETEAGEAILLHNFLLHRSGVNPTGRPRRAFSAAYMDATTRTLSTGQTFPVIFGQHALKPEPAGR